MVVYNSGEIESKFSPRQSEILLVLLAAYRYKLWFVFA